MEGIIDSVVDGLDDKVIEGFEVRKMKVVRLELMLIL